MRRRPTMVTVVKEYLAYRRDLGFALDISGKLLLKFARFADRSEHRGPLTTDLALRWASLPETASARYRAERLSIVRGFARYLAARDCRSEVPDRRLLYFGPQNILSDCVTGLIGRSPAFSPRRKRGVSILSFSGLGSHQLGISLRYV